MHKRNNIWPIVIVLLGAISYGLGTVAFKMAIADGWSVKHLTFHQVLSGAIMLWLALGVSQLSKDAPSLKSTWKAWLKLSVIGIVGLSLTTVFYNEALARLDASLGIVLLFQYAWITILLESIRNRKWPTRKQWISVIFIVTGTIFAVGLVGVKWIEIDGIGLIYGIMSAITYSLFFFLTGFLPSQLEPIAKSAVMSTASLIFVILLQAPSTFDWNVNSNLIGWGIALGFLGAAFPFFCFNYGIPKIGSGMAALLGSMELPAAVIAAFFLLREPLTPWQGLGVGLIIVGIMVVQWKSRLLGISGKEGEL